MPSGVFVPALNTVRIAIEYALRTRIVVNVVHGQKSTTVTDTDLASLISQVLTWWGTAKASFHSDIGLVAVRTRDLTTQNGLVNDYLSSSPIAGTVGGVCAPGNLAVAVSFRTGLAGRSFRGRMYLAGIPEAGYTNDHLDSGYTSVFAGVGADLGDAIEAVTGFTHVVASFQSAGSPRGTALLTPITQYICDSRVDTQRRRLPRN